jgi:hypothetical protein
MQLKRLETELHCYHYLDQQSALSTYFKYENNTQMVHLVSGILLTQLPGLIGLIMLFAF